jgi:HAD superfamily hydrolase (TIGR01509 family)
MTLQAHLTLQAVMFDMDGLLVDSEPLWFEAEAAIMTRLGSPWGPADQQHLIGGSLARSTAYMHSKAAEPVPREVIGQWLTAGMADLVRARGVQVMPGALDLLAEVAEAGLPHALVTSAEPEIMAAALDSIGVRFPVTVCAADVARGKPDPEPYLQASARLGVAPGRSVARRTHPPASGPRTSPGSRRSRSPVCRPARAGPADRPVARASLATCGGRGGRRGDSMTEPL